MATAVIKSVPMKSNFAISRLCSEAAISRKKYASVARKSSSEYCMEMVRKYDYENYLCSLLLPKEARSASFAIRALNTELAQIKDQTSNPAIGQMRIEFWKETLDKIFKQLGMFERLNENNHLFNTDVRLEILAIYANKKTANTLWFGGNPPQQPIALELTRILERQKMSKHFFSRLINSREQTLTDKPYQTISELEDYAENSVSSIYYLLFQSAGVNNIHCDHVASHLGKCQGILNHIRAIPYNSARGHVQIPIESIIKNNISEEDILRRKKEKSIKNLVYDIASVAHQHLNLARSMKKNVPKHVTKILLPSVACDSYLSRLQKEDFDVFSTKLQLRNNRLPLILWWQGFRNNY